MSESIEMSVDNQGCIMVPSEIQDRLGLSPGMTLVVEEGEKGEMCLRVQTELPELVDKRGVLVVKSDATGDLADAVGRERGRRLSDLMQRVDL
jgi:bifunctional DNA-binding transcriptional regulator/antitoxin component of YhaV-PrlF toxin-antitoxin module